MFETKSAWLYTLGIWALSILSNGLVSIDRRQWWKHSCSQGSDSVRAGLENMVTGMPEPCLHGSFHYYSQVCAVQTQ